MTVGHVIVLSLLASLNPTLVAATTVMLLLPSPAKLMLGYLLGALMTSVTLGLVIVFSLSDSSAANTTQNTLSPVADIALGALALVVAFTLATGRHERFAERRRERKQAKPDKGPPRWQRELSKGSARTTFVIGALLTLPGASYLAGLDDIDKLNYSTTVTVLVVLGLTWSCCGCWRFRSRASLLPRTGPPARSSGPRPGSADTHTCLWSEA